ncbi:MAG: TolC family protein [Spirochaetia bacterium]|nr:TolC family protein [Spirochaetia bacterium]
MDRPSLSFKIIAVLFISSLLSCRSGDVRPFNDINTNERFYRTEKIIDESLRSLSEANQKTYQSVLVKEKLNVDDLYTLALRSSEKIAINGEDIIQSREKVRQAWGAVLPSVSFRASLYAPDTGATGVVGGTFSRGYRFYARQNILTGLDEYSGLKGSGMQEIFNISQLKSEAALLYDQIALVFFEYLILEDTLITQKILLDNSVELKKELEKRYNIGKVRRSEILSIEVMIDKTEAAVLNLNTQLNNAQKRIKDLTGLSAINKNFIPEDPLEVKKINLEHYIGQAMSLEKISGDNLSDDVIAQLEKRPSMMSLKTNWELAKLDSIRALGGHLPKIYLEGSYRLPDARSPKGDYYGGIIAEVPIFSGGIVHSQYLAAKSRERQAELRYQEALRNAKDELVYFLYSWDSGEKAREMLRQAKEKAEKNYQTILYDYRIGQATNLEVLSALNEAATVKEQYEKTRLNQMLTIIHIKIITGELP